MMNEKHLSLDALIDAYYGVAGDPVAVRAHLAKCDACTELWNEVARKRSAAAQPVEASADFLAAQRRKIYERLEQPAPTRWKLWVPTAVAAALLAAGIFTLRPAHEVPHQEITDAQLFSEVYTMEQSYEPTAAAPIQALFEEQN